MSFVTADNLAHDSIFLQKVRVAITTAAVAVQAEDPGTANHTNRTNYAKLVLNSPDAYLQPFSNAAVANVAISAASTDSDIQFTINSIWNAMAGMV